MNIYDILEQRKSIRQYQNREVSGELLNKILKAAIQTSSSGNMQTYSIIVTRDKELREKLYPLHFEQNMVLDAPVLVTFCADFHRMRRWIALKEAPENFDNFMSFMISSIDAILVSQTVSLLAESEGLGICYMGTTLANCEKIGEVLELPPNVVPVVGFSLGYPSEAPSARDRLPMKALVHYERYQKFSDQDVLDAYKDREDKGMKRYADHPNVQNLAQVYTKLKYTRQSHLEYSNTVLKYLDKQNFMNNK